VQAELGAVRDHAKQEAEAGLTLRVREKEEQIASMQRQIEDLRRKAEQGSQQLQGEVPELELEAVLRQKFPRDVFEPVPKGEFGGDLIQRVVGPAGQICGSILWEGQAHQELVRRLARQGPGRSTGGEGRCGADRVARPAEGPADL
jgi:hypothetical protein